MSNTNLVVAWVSELEHGLARSPATIRRYVANVGRALEWMAQVNIEPATVTAELLRAYVGPELHRAGLSPRSRRAHISAIKSFYKFLTTTGVCKVSPAASLQSPYAGRPLPTVMTQSTLAKLLMACDLSNFKGLRDAALVGLLADTAGRASTLCSLNESSLLWDQDGERELLTIRLVGKGGVEHLAPVGDEARLMLRAYMGHREWLSDSLLLDNADRPLLVNIRSAVPGRDRQGERRRLTRKGVWHIVQKLGQSAGVPTDQCHPHAFRHMAGTAVYEATGDIKAVQEHLAHRNIASAEIYTHLAMERKRAIAAASGMLNKLDNVWAHLARAEAGARP